MALRLQPRSMNDHRRRWVHWISFVFGLNFVKQSERGNTHSCYVREYVVALLLRVAFIPFFFPPSKLTFAFQPNQLSGVSMLSIIICPTNL